MSEFLALGALIGALIGLLHMLHTMMARLGQPGLDPLKTCWQGLWTWGLWTLFGAYVLAFWVLGAICLAASRLLSLGRAAR